MKQYLKSLQTILEEGVREPSRTGVDRIRYHGVHYRFNLNEGLPIVTSKKMATKTLIKELLWFMRGESNIRPLLLENVRIWTPDAFKKFMTNHGDSEFALSLKGLEYKEQLKQFENKVIEDEDFAKTHGELGPVYGVQWRNRSGKIDQMMNAINELKNNPTSSRIIVDAWNPEEIDEMTLPPCHYSFQMTAIDGELNLHLNQRSGDMFLGVPFNITSYSILTYWIAQMTGLKPGVFTHTIGDAHIYANHVESVKAQLKNGTYPLPTLTIKDKGLDIDAYQLEDFVIEGYRSHEKIHGELSV